MELLYRYIEHLSNYAEATKETYYGNVLLYLRYLETKGKKDDESKKIDEEIKKQYPNCNCCVSEKLKEDGYIQKIGKYEGHDGPWWPDEYIQQDTFIGNGELCELEPKFSYKGFKYIHINCVFEEGWKP